MSRAASTTKNLEALINEVVLSQHATQFSSSYKFLYNEDYVRGVLGIDIPLNESYPYSYELQERILQEQLLLEGFFDDFKKLGSDTKNAALALRYIMQDSTRLEQFMALVKSDLEAVYKPLSEFLEKIVETAKGLSSKVANALKKVSEWAQSLLEKIRSFVDSALAGSGWKAAMTISGALVAVGFIWSKLEGVAPKITEKLAELADSVSEVALVTGIHLFEGEENEELDPDSKVGKAVKAISKLLFTAVKKIGEKALKNLTTDAIGAALTGGIFTAFKALKALYGGSKVVFGFLGGPIEKFLSKIKNPEEEAEEAEEGEDDPTEAAWHDDERLLREYIRAKLLVS